MSKNLRLLVIHGPNINMLGTREPGIYGTATIDEINSQIQSHAEEKGVEISIHQSNSEGAIIDIMHEHADFDGLVINPAAYTHTSIAIYDAILACGIPAVEVHISNIHAREEFRKTSLIAPACVGQVAGFGGYSYVIGIDALLHYIQQNR